MVYGLFNCLLLSILKNTLLWPLFNLQNYCSFLRKVASLITQLVKNPLAMQETPVRFLGQEDLLEKGQATHPVFLGFPCGSTSKESTCYAGVLGLIPELGRSLEKGKATHSSILAWRIPWTIHSMGSQRVRHH